MERAVWMTVGCNTVLRQKGKKNNFPLLTNLEQETSKTLGKESKKI